MFVLIFSILALSITLLALFNTYKKIKDTEYEKQKTMSKISHVCPDYWEVVKQEFDANGKIKSVSCKNTHQLGKCAISPNDIFKFEDDIFYDKETDDVSRCKWAKRCGVSWQGYNDICG